MKTDTIVFILICVSCVIVSFAIMKYRENKERIQKQKQRQLFFQKMRECKSEKEFLDAAVFGIYALGVSKQEYVAEFIDAYERIANIPQNESLKGYIRNIRKGEPERDNKKTNQRRCDRRNQNKTETQPS